MKLFVVIVWYLHFSCLFSSHVNYCSKLQPLFLQRNLTYMPRHSRKSQRRWAKEFVYRVLGSLLRTYCINSAPESASHYCGISKCPFGQWQLLFLLLWCLLDKQYQFWCINLLTSRTLIHIPLISCNLIDSPFIAYIPFIITLDLGGNCSKIMTRWWWVKGTPRRLIWNQK